MPLSEYFQPLNPATISLFFLLFFSFDLWGTFIKSFFFKRQPDTSRVINWLVGLGFFSLLWFLLRFFLPPNQLRVALTILALDLIALPHYLSSGELKKLATAWWQLKFPLLIIVPLFPAVFIKASLPPYYSDEMAYHFISPAQLAHLSTWRFDGDFYQSLPQVLDLFFVLAFALTKTYSVARLTIFAILATAMLFAFSSFKRLFGRLSAYFFIFAFFSLPQALVLTATVGFVDVAAYSFMLIGLVLLIEFFLNSSSPTLYLSSIFWGLALGTKYTSLSAFAAILPAALLLIFSKIKLRNFAVLLLLLTVFGGYWYIKNWVAYGNPLYPMFGGQTAINFTGNWTTPVDLAHLRAILEGLFPGNRLLQIFILVTPLLVWFNRAPKVRIVSLFLVSSVVLELIILKYFSGFYARYHQHLQLWLLLLLSIQFTNRYRLIFLTIFLFLLVNFIQTVKITYQPSFLTRQEISYATGKLDIYGWVKAELPRVYDVIRWCENPPGGEVPIVFVDPDMIWFEKDGYLRSFLTNCYLEKDIPLEGVPVENLLDQARRQKLKFITASINQCLPDSQIGPKRGLRDDLDERTIYLRQLSNQFLCHSQEIIPHLYYFDYEVLNP